MWLAALMSAPYATLTYGRPDHIPPGVLSKGGRVLAPLGGGVRMAVLLERVNELPPDFPGDAKLKDIIWPAENEPLLEAAYVDMVRSMAARQMTEPGKVLETLLPAGLRKPPRFRVYDAGFPARIGPKTIASLEPERKKELWRLWEAGRMRVLASKDYARKQEYCFLAEDPPWPVRPGANRQLQVLELLYERGALAWPVLLGELGREAGPALTRLVELGLVEIGSHPLRVDISQCDSGETDQVPEPSEEQRACLDRLAAALARESPGTSLLFGITGSGKTLVYTELAGKVLQAGRSVMLLAPEVALACMLEKRLRRSLPDAEVRLYHGYLPPAERERIFTETAHRKEPMVVVGTRSALFLPLREPGLIVLDEEHDSSFKQEERYSYQAKEIAFYRARESGGLLVLGSATPDVKTYHAAGKGDIGLSTLASRVGGGVLPKVELVDISGLKPDQESLAEETASALSETVASGKQAVILLNRRGYSPLMYCLECGKIAKCSQCDVGLTYHKSRERLVCHYCGLSAPFPSPCSECGSVNFLPMGGGTERLEEELEAVLPPGTETLRLDRDSARRPGRMDEILSDFSAGKASVLLGTQMLSKGHHLPNVTLAVVADGDLGLNLPDYRAAERTFQLLVQVSGRAGRGEDPGRVLIQTRNPGHYCWKYVMQSDYQGFYEQELAKRERYGYPPFVKLGLVRFSYPEDYELGGGKIMELARVLGSLGKQHGVKVLGPAPAPLSLIRGRRRYQCMLKAVDWISIRNVYYEMSKRMTDRKVRLSLDLDPVNML
jgi:primosomal protein N' (replication factor Y)